MEIPEMVYTLKTRRLTSILAVGLIAAAGLVTTPAQAQEPGGRFRVLVPNPEVEGGVKESFSKSVANETKKLIDGMVTHRSLEKGDLNRLLKQFNLKEKDLNCITSQQLAVQGGIELVMCGTIKPAGSEMEVEATFVTADQTRFEVPPVTGSDAKVVAQHIFKSFETFVNQLRLVQFCTEDLGSSQWSSALERCEQALALNSASQPALYGKGYALMQMERFDESFGALQGLLELNPIHPEGLQAAGYVTAKLGRTDQSRSYFQQYLELNPGNAQVRLTIALDAFKGGDAEGALEMIEQGLSEGTSDMQLLEYAGYFAAAAGARKLEGGSGANGENAAGRAEARVYYQKAVDFLGKVHAEQGSEAKVDVVVQLVNAMAQLGRAAEAVDLGAKAVGTHGGEATVWRAYAMALREAGRTADAIAAMDSVLERDPEAQNIRAQQAQWLLQEGKLEEAGTAFRRAVDAGELEAEAAGMNIFAVGVNEKYQKGKQGEAIPYFEMAQKFVTKHQSKGMVNFFLGLVHYNRGIEAQKPETAASARVALPLFQRALELFKQSQGYAEGSAAQAKSVNDHMDAAQQYIDIQEALIKRGR
jgi:tetratricopeptide (TPR) repeat protein